MKRALYWKKAFLLYEKETAKSKELNEEENYEIALEDYRCWQISFLEAEKNEN